MGERKDDVGVKPNVDGWRRRREQMTLSLLLHLPFLPPFSSCSPLPLNNPLVVVTLIFLFFSLSLVLSLSLSPWQNCNHESLKPTTILIHGWQEKKLQGVAKPSLKPCITTSTRSLFPSQYVLTRDWDDGREEGRKFKLLSSDEQLDDRTTLDVNKTFSHTPSPTSFLSFPLLSLYFPVFAWTPIRTQVSRISRPWDRLAKVV